jgi:hypothetical protein
MWTLRAIAVLLSFVSAFGFLNAFYFRIHGPGADLGLVAGVLAVLAWMAARWERRNSDWLVQGSATASEPEAVRVQVASSSTDYDDFMKPSPRERRARFDAIGAEAEDRAMIVQTHLRRWVNSSRGRLSTHELAVFEEITAFLSLSGPTTLLAQRTSAKMRYGKQWGAG